MRSNGSRCTFGRRSAIKPCRKPIGSGRKPFLTIALSRSSKFHLESPNAALIDIPQADAELTSTSLSGLAMISRAFSPIYGHPTATKEVHRCRAVAALLRLPCERSQQLFPQRLVKCFFDANFTSHGSRRARRLWPGREPTEATGCPDLAMMISSPLAARSTSRRNCVLA